MPGRQSHGGAPTKAAAKVKTSKSKKRSQNAFAIATQENQEKVKLNRHRRGQLEGPDGPRKRARDLDDDGEDDEMEDAPRKHRKKGDEDDMDMNAGSDSEGNNWRLGEVDSDDDSEIDSDEAFGESDVERFEGYAFSGSTTRPKKVTGSKRTDVTLDEAEDDDDRQNESEEDSLGEDAIDLATVLDQAEAESEEDGAQTLNTGANLDEDDNDDDDDDESSDSDQEYSASSVDLEDSRDPEKLSALQGLVANLPQAEEKPASSKNDDDEFSVPSSFGVKSRTKLTLEDLGLETSKDPQIKKSIKLLGSGHGGNSATLAVPLSKRQQDRLDRAAAYEKSKDMLDRWNDTVQHNRRAEHLSFPLVNNDDNSIAANTRLQLPTANQPFNELEATIQTIMEESGLAASNGKDDEAKLREYEELQEKKMTVEEVRTRREELRKARDLMFREEAKAKRIKKIKSKSYRKVHRKQREKEERINQEALREAGIEPSEDELEAQERRRATARMGDKHRGSKWAKSARETGRAAWDEDARAGISEMARREDELRKRVEGRSGRSGAGSDDSTYEDSDDGSDIEASRNRILAKLNGLDEPTQAASGSGSKLANMKFMLKADASRRKENEEMVEQIRRELDGEESEKAEEPEGDVGRRVYGPVRSASSQTLRNPLHSEFEEPEGPDRDMNDRHGSSQGGEGQATAQAFKDAKTKMARRQPTLPLQSSPIEDDTTGGAWSKPISRRSAAETSDARRKKNDWKATDADEIDISAATIVSTLAAPTPLPTATKLKPQKSTATFMKDEISDDSDAQEAQEDTAVHARLPFAIRDAALIKRAFAGADVVGEFEAEKRAIIAAEEDQVVDNTIPGWGSWVGEGLSKRAAAKNMGRFITKTEGIQEKDRKDHKLDKVIVNQKKVKKNSKYLAPQLPFPFETKQQYERSLRLPVGPEWTTKETFQEATKPRILVKQGIIAPMEKPLL